MLRRQYLDGELYLRGTGWGAELRVPGMKTRQRRRGHREGDVGETERSRRIPYNRGLQKIATCSPPAPTSCGDGGSIPPWRASESLARANGREYSEPWKKDRWPVAPSIGGGDGLAGAAEAAPSWAPSPPPTPANPQRRVPRAPSRCRSPSTAPPVTHGGVVVSPLLVPVEARHRVLDRCGQRHSIIHHAPVPVP